MIIKRDPRTKTYDYESPDQWMAITFCKILTQMHIGFKDDMVPNHIGSSYIKFWCTPKERVIVEYIYRRAISKEQLYLMDLSGYQRNAYKLRRDKYAIY